MKKIFLSYRRADSAHVTDRIYACLRQEFGEHAIFKDVDDVPIGEDFREHIADAVGRCDILLAVIGHNWLDIQDEKGNRRLEDKDDFVRVEIEGVALPKVFPVNRDYLHDGKNVWIMDEEDRLKILSVEIVFRDKETVYLSNGLHPGDRIVTTDISAPVDGMLLRLDGSFADPEPSKEKPEAQE